MYFLYNKLVERDICDEILRKCIYFPKKGRPYFNYIDHLRFWCRSLIRTPRFGTPHNDMENPKLPVALYPQGYRLLHLGSEIAHFEPCNSLKGELCQAVALPLVQLWNVTLYQELGLECKGNSSEIIHHAAVKTGTRSRINDPWGIIKTEHPLPANVHINVVGLNH